jgi:hypothetical protein
MTTVSEKDQRHPTAALPKGARVFELPPKGFDPMTASADELRRFGLPRRPDPHTEPHLARLYASAFSRPHTFLKPELVVDSRLDAINAKKKGIAGFSSGDWGGAVVTTPASDPRTWCSRSSRCRPWSASIPS